jgi:hypothetical protein
MREILGRALCLSAAACSAGGADSRRDSTGVEFSTPAVNFGDALGSAPSGAGGDCVGETYASEKVPLDLYFLIDLSGSMAEPAGSSSKWDLVSRALEAFLTAPESAGLGLGVGYFPLNVQSSCTPGQAGCLCIPFINLCLPNIGGSCDAQDYAVPGVPLAVAPAAAAISADIQRQVLQGGTPTRPALQGALQYAGTWADQHPERTVAVVLATDGDPAGCDTNAPADVAAVAAAAWSGPHQIRTFVIGVGNSLSSLDLVAAAGGTTRAFLTSDGGDLSRQFTEALGQIRIAAGGCTYEIPAAPAGSALDPALVNVSVSGNGAARGSIVPMTSRGLAGSCGPEGGWYYDNPSAPGSINLCPASCGAVAESRVEIQLGCQTVQLPR